MRYYVVSDIHSFYTPFVKALTDAGYYEDNTPHKLLILGDLFDRGQEAVKMQNYICELLATDDVILIRGNHEDLFEQLVTEDEGLPYGYHKQNGTYGTALQLTGYDETMAQIRHYDFAEAAQKTDFYQVIMPAMRDYFETEHYIFVHGWIPCLFGRDTYHFLANWRNVADRHWRESRWINGMEAFQTVYDENKTIVCGHWHASFGHSVLDHNGSEFGPDADFRPYYGSGIIAIDACTSASGFVNCIVIDD